MNHEHCGQLGSIHAVHSPRVLMWQIKLALSMQAPSPISTSSGSVIIAPSGPVGYRHTALPMLAPSASKYLQEGHLYTGGQVRAVHQLRKAEPCMKVSSPWWCEAGPENAHTQPRTLMQAMMTELNDNLLEVQIELPPLAVGGSVPCLHRLTISWQPHLGAATLRGDHPKGLRIT